MKSVAKKSSILLLSLFCVLESSMSQAQTTERLPDDVRTLPPQNSRLDLTFGGSGGSVGPGTSNFMAVLRADGEHNIRNHHANANLALNMGGVFGVRAAGQYAYDLSGGESSNRHHQAYGTLLGVTGTSTEGAPLNALVVGAGYGYNMNFSSTNRRTSTVEVHQDNRGHYTPVTEPSADGVSGNFVPQTAVLPITAQVRPRGGLAGGYAGGAVFGLDAGIDAQGILGATRMGANNILTAEGRFNADLILGGMGGSVGAGAIVDARLAVCVRSTRVSDSLRAYCAGIRGAGQSFGNTGSGEGGIFISGEWGSGSPARSAAVNDADRAPASRPAAVVAPVAAPVAAPVPVAAPAPAQPAPAPVAAPAPATTLERAQDAQEAQGAEDAADETDVQPAADSTAAQ